MNPTSIFTPAVFLGLALSVSACTGAGPDASFSERDPYEGYNRSIHSFNVALDRAVLRPVAQGYDTVTPGVARLLISNALNHLDTLNNLANYTLQGEVEPALDQLGRLTINTLMGAGGLLDPATEFGLRQADTDFGVTLGKYGVEEGAYLVLPFLGPSTFRDAGGRIGDLALDPLTYTGVTSSSLLNVVSPVKTAVEVVELRARNADLIDDLIYESDDSYISLRTVYLQRRDAMIYGGAAEGNLPDIFDETPAN
jgi:phospholipid-binding lipoprotein MlaA